LSGVPQGSVLGPILFLIFVNDLPEWMISSIKLFADDTKIWKEIRSEDDQLVLQTDLNRLTEWSDKWLLRLHPDKCKVMHINHKFDTAYYLQDSLSKHQLIETTMERDLGVLVSNKMKFTDQCTKAAAKANAITGLIRRHFKKLNKKDLLFLYKTYIRPHLEYCIQAWSPHLKKDIIILEAVQRRATKLVASFKGLDYVTRLRKLGLTTLERRRSRGDLIETFKLLTSREGIEYSQFFTKSQSSYDLRGHSLKLQYDRSKLNARKYFFSQRVVQVWNSLPQTVVEANSINQFKNRLDEHWHNMSA
jgi:hypothetical protein